MGSNLSQGTKYALEYNQASRNLACIASQTIIHLATFSSQWLVQGQYWINTELTSKYICKL